MSDWEGSSSGSEESSVAPATKPKTGAAPPAKKPVIKAPVAKSKFAGEDEEEEDTPVSDWEESSDEEDDEPVVAAPVAAPRKKGTLKAKLAEKEAIKATKTGDDGYDSDEVLDPREKLRRDRERELAADMDNAASLMGGAALGGTSSKALDNLISANPRTKEDFIALSDQIISVIFSRLESKPLYATFIEHHARAICMPLRDVEVRKVASGLTTLSNEKQKEARDKASGKKKPKAAGKPILGAAKAGKMDTKVYDEALDDFGSNADDFM